MSQQPKNSALDFIYTPLDRPISQKELTFLEKKILNNLKLSYYTVINTKNKWEYHVKRYGKKESEIMNNKNNKVENYNEDVGNCSVAWKLSKTPKHLKKKAYQLVDEYMHQFVDNKGKKNHYKLEILKAFYTWLYFEKHEED